MTTSNPFFSIREVDVECESCHENFPGMVTGKGVVLTKICGTCAARREAEQREAQRKAQEETWAVMKAGRKDRIFSFLTASGIPKRFHAAEFDTMTVDENNREAVQAAAAWIGNKHRGWAFVLSGTAGVGKTYLAAAMARAFILELFDVRFISILDYLERLMSGYRDGVAGATEAIEPYYDAPVLVLDDLGTEKTERDGKPTPKAAEIIFQLIDHRYNDLRPTIITTNLDGAQIASRYGVRTMSRIKDGGQIIYIKGSDRRLAAGRG